MQENVSVNGIILSDMPIGEADRRLSILTKELGKISCFVRNARKPTSPFVGIARPFTCGEFQIYPGKNSYSLSSIQVKNYFESLFLNPEKSAYGCCFLEIAGRFSHENTDGTETLTLLYYALTALEKGKIPSKILLLAFIGRILQSEGVYPSFSHCIKCGKPITNGAFSPQLSGPLCDLCMGAENPYLLSKSAIYTLEHIRTSEVKALFSFSLTEDVYREVNNVIQYLLRNADDRPFSSLEILKVLEKEPDLI